jgi:hypothetical protein
MVHEINATLKQTLAAYYRQYLNEFLTPVRFAQYHGMSKDQALTILSLGRVFHEEGAIK